MNLFTQYTNNSSTAGSTSSTSSTYQMNSSFESSLLNPVQPPLTAVSDLIKLFSSATSKPDTQASHVSPASSKQSSSSNLKPLEKGNANASSYIVTSEKTAELVSLKKEGHNDHPPIFQKQQDVKSIAANTNISKQASETDKQKSITSSKSETSKSEQTEIDNQYIKIAKYYTEKDGSLCIAHTNEKLDFSTKTMHTVLEIARKMHLGNKDSKIFRNGTHVKIDKDEFLAKIEQEKIEIYHYSGKSLIASGAEGDVYKIFNVSRCIFEAIKKVKTRKEDRLQEKANISIEREILVLNSFEDAKLKGVQSSPTTSLDLITEDNEVIKGFIGELYTTSFCEFGEKHSCTPSAYLELMFVLIQTTHQLHEAGYGHGDIKPENLLLKIENDQIIKFDLADCAHVISEESSIKEAISHAKNVSPETTSPYDMTILFNDYNKMSVKEILEYVIKRDIYSIGSCIFLAITGYFPYKMIGFYDYEGMEAPLKDSHFFKELLIKAKLTEEVCNIFTGMLIQDPSKRLTMPQILKARSEIKVFTTSS